MSLEAAERTVRWAGALAVTLALACILWGIARALRRPRGRATGLAHRTARLPFYLLAAVLFFTPCILLWQPLPLKLSAPARTVVLALGALLLFPGLALSLWGRITLGEMYHVSSSTGVQLHADHRLVTHGPFAAVRHPMYLGLIVAATGGLLIYRTWTLVFLVLAFLGLSSRARREDEALAAEFGEEWEAYRRRVPGWIPRIRGRLRGRNRP